MFILAIIMCYLLFGHHSASGIIFHNFNFDKMPVLGQGIKLLIDYNLEGEELYAIKYYKNGFEFLQFIPLDEPNITIFDVPGFTVDITKCSSNVVVLTDLKESLSGRYKCTITTEAPFFHSSSKFLNITITSPNSKQTKNLNVTITSEKSKKLFQPTELEPISKSAISYITYIIYIFLFILFLIIFIILFQLISFLIYCRKLAHQNIKK